jgi:tetratricopeptide (TPR) repeat protein
VRTRLEYMIRSRAVKPSELARRSGYSRQLLARMREGCRTLTRSENDVAEALRAITHEDLPRDAVFEEKQPSLVDFLPTSSKQQRRGSEGSTKKHTLADQLLEMTEETFEASLAHLRGSAASEAAVRELLDAGKELLDRKPRRADELYSLASDFVASLPHTPAALGHSLRGLAQKGRANSLRMIGKYADSLAALQDSECEFQAARYCKHELGLARYCRATVLFKMERWVEAYRAAHSGRGFLEAEHDHAGVVNCDILKACITLEWGELDRAREMFLALRKTVEARRDYRRLADLSMNLVVCNLRRGDTFEAGLWLGRAVRKFRELGLASEVTRARWCGATLALAQGQRVRAFQEFKAAASEFEALGMPVDAAFVRLELLGALIEDRKWREAEPIAVSVANLLLAAGVRPSAATALEYLREAVKKRSADRETVTRVTRHIRRVGVFPDEPFSLLTEGPA